MPRNDDQITFSLPRAWGLALRQYAEEWGWSTAELLRYAIQNGLQTDTRYAEILRDAYRAFSLKQGVIANVECGRFSENAEEES